MLYIVISFNIKQLEQKCHNTLKQIQGLICLHIVKPYGMYCTLQDATIIIIIIDATMTLLYRTSYILKVYSYNACMHIYIWPVSHNNIVALSGFEVCSHSRRQDLVFSDSFVFLWIPPYIPTWILLVLRVSSYVVMVAPAVHEVLKKSTECEGFLHKR